MNDQLLSKLMDTMDDVKERLIRIEEGQKDIKDIKVDVANLKIAVAAIESSAKSNHKRTDEVEREMVSRVEYESVNERLKKIEKVVYWGASVIVGSVLLSILGLVLIKN